MRPWPVLVVLCLGSTLSFAEPPIAAEPPCWNLRSCRASCDAGNALGCRLLAERYREGKGLIPISLSKAAVEYERGCGLGDLSSCTTLAELLFDGAPGLPRNVAKAIELHETACTKGALTSCVTLGHLYLTGASVPKDLDRARARYEHACRGGAREGCDSLALVGVTQENRGGTSHLREECSVGKSWACTVLKQLGVAAAP